MKIEIQVPEALSERVYKALKWVILATELVHDNQALNIKETAEQIGVSTTLVREALKRLASEGLVEWVPNKGVYIKKFGEGDLFYLFEIRRRLEPYWWQIIASQAKSDASLRAELRHLKNDLRAFLASLGRKGNEDKGDFCSAKYMELDHRFQSVITEYLGCTSGLMKDIANLVNNYVIRLRLFSGEDARGRNARMRAVIKEHLGILDAVLAGDEIKVERAVRQHLARAWARLASGANKNVGSELRKGGCRGG